MWLSAFNIVIVTVMPMFITPIENEVEVIVMENVTLYCEGNGEPTITYVWLYENESGKLFKYIISFLVS